MSVENTTNFFGDSEPSCEHKDFTMENKNSKVENSNADAMSNTVLTITSRADIKNYCKKNHISISAFNTPVLISENVKNCSSMFDGCKSFNQPIEIPKGVENCLSMFRNCKNFNQPIELPNSVRECSEMFRSCKNFNQAVTLPESVVNSFDMFMNCTKLDKSLIPENVTKRLIISGGNPSDSTTYKIKWK